MILHVALAVDGRGERVAGTMGAGASRRAVDNTVALPLFQAVARHATGNAVMLSKVLKNS